MAKLDDFIPTKLLDNPVPMHSHWESYRHFVRATVPATVAGVIMFALALAAWSWQLPIEFVALFGMAGCFLLFINIYAIFVFEDERLDKVWRQNIYSQQLTIINVAIQNMTIVQRATHVNVGTTVPQVASTHQPQLLYPEVDTEINATYQVARAVLTIALKAWRENNNTRPKIKTISFDAVVKQVETGHARWKAALEMLEDAKILRSATMANWAPIVFDELSAVRLLDASLIARGFYSHMKNGQPEWRRALPQGEKNV